MSRLSASGPRWSSLLRGARAAALVALGLGALLGTAGKAQAAVLVSNLEQTAVLFIAILSSNDFAQGFETGSNTGNYTLASIDIDFSTNLPSAGDASKLTVTLWSGTSGDRPGSLLATLTNPSNLSTGGGGNVKTFTARAGTVLIADTMYFVHMSYAGGGSVTLDSTASTNQDTSSAAGWTLNDIGLWGARGSTGSWSARVPIKVRINGTVGTTAANTAPTGSNNTVTTQEGTPHVFASAEFGFDDADGSDALLRVTVVTVPGAGMLALEGTAVTANQVVPRTDIDDGHLTFTPAAGASGDSYASFTFRVSDGRDVSVDAYTMTIDVTPAPVACPAPDFEDRRKFWEGALTVHAGPLFNGFNSYGGTGALTPATFTIGRNVYTVSLVSTRSSATDRGDLLFGLTDPLTDPLTTAEVAALRLHVCAEGFDFSDAPIDFLGNHEWEADLDWSMETTRTLYLSLPANNAATGEPAITGTAQAGQELTADASPIMDTDVLPSSFTYKWFRVDSDGTSNEAEISGETDATYTLTDDDVGKKVKVKVSFTDELSGEEERTSAAYPSSGTVTAAGGTNTAPTAANKTVTTGEDRAYTFTAADFGFMDADAGAALASVKIVTVPALGTLTLDYTAVNADAVVTKAQIDGDMLIFTPAQDADGAPYTTFTFKVNDGTVDSASAYTMTIDVTDAPAPVCAAPSFGDRREIWSGTVTVEALETLGIVAGYGFDEGRSAGTLLPSQSFSIGSNSYSIDQILLGISGGLFFSLDGSDQLTDRENVALRLHVCDGDYDFNTASSFSDRTDTSWNTTLDWSHPVVTRTVYLSLPENNDATGEPAISGTAQVGQALTADASPILDTNGLTDVDFTYQWLRVDADGTSDEEDISDEIAATYTLTDADVGKKVKVKVSFTDELSGVEMRTSAAYPSSGTVMASTDDDVIPVLSTATVDGASLVLTYGEALDPGSVPVAGDFAVSVAGLTAVVSNVAVSGNTVTLTLANAVAPGQTVTLGYTVPTGTDAMPLQDIAGNDAGPLTSQAVINNSLSVNDTVAPVLSTATVDGASLVLTYGEALDPGSVPVAGDFAVSVAGLTAVVSNVAVSGNTVTLTLANAVAPGQTVTLGYTVPTGTDAMPLQDLAGNDAGPLTSQAVINNSLSVNDTVAPVLSTATVDGTSLVLTYGEALDPGSVPVASDFAVSVAGLTAVVSNVAVSGNTVTLTLANAVAPGQTVTLGYTVPTGTDAMPLQDLAGNDAGPLTSQAVINNSLSAPGAPTGLTATARGQAWIDLAWTAPVPAGAGAITGYRIEVSPDGSSWSDLVADTGSTATTYVHMGLNAGATRHYRVSAINAVGTSDPSGSDDATTRTDEQLVSNFNHRGDADNEHLAIQNVVGIFTTGSRDARLNSIELKLGKFTSTSDTPALKLYEVESVANRRATAGDLVATLITHTTSLPRHSVRTFTYDAPSGTSLTASKKYIFVLEAPTRGIVLVETTNDLAEDAVKADGWTIDGSGSGTSPYYINAARQIVVRVNGKETPNTAPTAADNTVTMPEDGRYEFSVTDFGFTDTNPADRLVSVQIVTVPAAGALTLDGAAVTAGDVVARADIDDDKLIFTPATGGSGDNYARFTFKVNDGTVFSAGAYTMRIDVTPTPPLTGLVFVDNTAESDYLEAVANGQSSQSFTTGPNVGGYILSSIGVVTSSAGDGDNFSVAVYNADANGAPLALRTSLIPPGNFRKGEKHTIHFHALPNTNLRPNTTYSIVLGPGRTLPHRRVIATQSDADNAGAGGWSIGDAFHTFRNRAWSNPNDGRSVKIVIRGRAARGVANNAPEFSLATVDRSLAENTAAGRNVGAVVTATDADNDPLSYTLGGADMASFDFDETTGQIRTKAGVSYDHEVKPSYTVTVTASDGTDSAVADVTISVTDVDEPPRAPATPVVSAVADSTDSLTVTWAAPANAGRPAIDSYDLQYRASGATDWIDGPDHSTTTTVTGPVAYTLHAARVTGLIADTLYEARVRAANAEGNSGWSNPPGAGRTNTLTNNAPVFSPAIVDRSIVENIAAGEDIGAPVTATDADNETLTYTLGGADAASFDFVGTTGQIRTKADVSYDFEARSSYTVTVTASDGAASAAANVTVSVTDVAEPPDAPATPEVTPVTFSATSLTVSWAAPANDGRPAIDGYDVQYRVGSTGTWTDLPQVVTGTTTTITGLTADTDYQVQVRAANAEGDSGWSDPPGAGRTHPLNHNAPMFSSLSQTREIEENTGAGENVGAAVTATDINNDTLNYTLGGADMASFDIVETTGQIRTRAGVSYDFEDKSSYTVTVTASDGAASAVATVTISVTDVPELPDTPATPTVSAVSGSTPSLSVSWIAPPNEGRPPIDHYHVQWHVSGATAWNGRDVDAPATTTIISDLTADTEYEVRVRADNAERDSGFADPWVGRTNTLTNNAPVFISSNVALSIAENTAAGVDVGDPVTATDADAGDTLSYTLRGADAEFFDIVDTTGQIRTKDNVSYDFEAKASYTVTVRVSDGAATAEASVIIGITDVDEAPDAPSTPTVSAVADSTTRLTVSWDAPANAGKPAIDSYDVQYRPSGATAWINGPRNVATTTTTVTGLTANTLYEAQVRATNDEGDSDWSDPPGSGRTNSATTNNAPVFSSSSVSRELAENTAAGVDIGAAVAATDDDGDTLGYTLGGADAASFDFVETTGQIRTKAGVSYDHEAKDSYTVTVTASDGAASAVATVTISVTDVDEPPDAPAQPTVNAVSGSATRLAVSWAAPANAGKPDIDNYDVQYRAGNSGTWSNGPQNVTTTSTTISGLAANTSYEVQVRATNDEGDSGWSTPPGSGRTNAPGNNAPVFNPASVSRSIAENTSAGQNVGAEVEATDGDGDTLSYTLGGADMAAFEIDRDSGQIRTKANVSYDHEAKSSYTVTVTASDSSNASADADVTISVTDVNEPPDAPATPVVSAVAGSNTSLSVSWAAPANAGKPDIDNYDVQYRVSGAAAWTDGPQNVTGTTETISVLVADTEYEVQVRATNDEGDSGWSAPPGAGRTNAAAISAPGVVGLTATTAVCADKRQYKRKQYGCVTLAWDEPVIDARTVLARMEYRFAESGSALLWSRWQLDGTHSRTGAVIDRLELGTEYVFEVRAVILEGPGPAVSTKIETPAAAVETGLISLHATQSDDVDEGGALTFEVRRSNELNSDELKRDTFVLVAVTDSAFPGGNRLLGEDGLGMRVVKFKPGARSARGTVRVAFDGARPSSRTVTVSLQSVEEDYHYGTPTTLDIDVNDRDAAVSVRDAQVSEGPGATLEFAVTLDRALDQDQDVTVKYATSDGTATAGVDYTHSAGTLVFSAGDTEKTVSVPVLDDVHNEGSETLLLTLSNAMGAVITDASATGTISNSDPLPKGWLARFGRTSATQVLGLLEARFDEARAPASQLTLGGRPIKLSGPGGNPQGRADPVGGPAAPLTPGGDSRGTADVGNGPAATHADRTAVPHSAGEPAAMLADPLATSDLAGGPAVAPADPFDALASRYTLDAAARGMADLHNDPVAMHADPAATPDPAGGAVGAGGEATLLERLAWRLLTRGGWSVDRRQFLSGSSFDLSLSALGRETDGAAIETARVRETPGHWSLWGRGALIRFAGQDTGISLDGDVLTGLLGLDYSRGRWLAGLGLAYNDGDGAYRAPDSGTAGKLDSTLVSVHPYLHYALTDRLSAWGTLGYGAGGLRLRPERDGAPEQAAIKTDIQMRMGALGLRGTVFASATTELALKSDLMWVRTASSATAGLAAVDGADASRVRLLLTGRHRHMLATGAVLTPNVELGLRYDGGAAETGAGVELGGGLRYADSVRGLTVEARARALLAHEDGGYEEWGLSGSLQLDPGRLGRGLSLRLASGWGLTDSGADALWQQQTASGLTQGAGQTSQGRIRAEWAYGLDVPRTHGLLTPYGSVEMAAGGGRTLALGWRFELGQSLSLRLTGERREALHVTPEHALMLQTTLPW